MTAVARATIGNYEPGDSEELRAQLSDELKIITAMGVTQTSIEAESGVNRGYISSLINRGTASCGAEPIRKLKSWVDGWKAAQGITEEGEADRHDGSYKTAPELIRTTALKGTLGFVQECIRERKFGVIIGQPGAGKTTVIDLIRRSHQKVVVVEAWTSMRMSDMMRKIAQGLGISIRGTIEERKDAILEELGRHSETILIIDEAEYLKKWNVEKIDVLRKMQDNAGFTLLMFGTNLFRTVIQNAALPQLQSRITCYEFLRTDPKEVAEELAGYNIEPEAAKRLAGLAGDVNHGGMRTYTRVLELCLYGAQGGRISMDIMEEAIRHKPGL